MTELLLVLLLLACLLAGLVLVPFGLPGLWLMVVGVLAYGWLTDFRAVSVTIVVVSAGLALVAEAIEAWVGFRIALRTLGPSRHAGACARRALLRADPHPIRKPLPPPPDRSP